MNNAARQTPYAHRTTKQVRHQNESEPDELMLLATERYCHANFYDRLTMRQYCEAFEILSSQIKRTTLQIVARSLASCPYAPRAVIMALAVERISVSRAILVQSEVLGQLDMLRIIDLASERHALMLAERHDIGPSVVGRLRELNIESIDEALDENPALVDQIASSETRKNTTADEPKDHDETGLDALAAVVAEIESEMSDPEQVLPSEVLEKRIVEELEAVPAAEAATDLLRAAARGGQLPESDAEPIQTAEVRTKPKAVQDLALSLERIAAAKSCQGMAALMAKESGFSLDTAFQVLEDTSGETLAVFLKNHEIEPSAANRILMLTFPSIGLSAQNAMRAVRFYKTLETESCREAVAQWPKDEPKQVEHQPYLEDSQGVRWAAEARVREGREAELEEARRRTFG